MFRVALCASAALGLWILWRKGRREADAEAPEAEALESLETGQKEEAGALESGMKP